MTDFADGGVVRWTPGDAPLAQLDNGYVVRKPEWAGRTLTFKLVDPAADMERTARTVEASIRSDGRSLLLAFKRAAVELERPLRDWENEGGALA